MSDAAWKRHLARKDKELAAAKAKYLASEEYQLLPTTTTEELVALYKNASDWLRHPCGMSDIDGAILARSSAVSEILQRRGVPFGGGLFFIKPASPATEGK